MAGKDKGKEKTKTKPAKRTPQRYTMSPMESFFVAHMPPPYAYPLYPWPMHQPQTQFPSPYIPPDPWRGKSAYDFVNGWGCGDLYCPGLPTCPRCVASVHTTAAQQNYWRSMMAWNYGPYYRLQ